MSEHHKPGELDKTVADFLSRGSHESFERCWKLYKETAYIPHPEGFYFRNSQDGTYQNLAIVGNNRIVDLEADEVGGTKNVTVSLCRAYSGVGLTIGPIPTIQRTRDALLTVFCRVAGSTSIGHYWTAQDEEESAQLQDFAKTVFESISRE